MPITSVALALREALREEMRRDERVFILGEDVAEFGGAYQITQGLVEEFGRERVRNTPISEEAIVGAAVGAAITGMRPVVEIQFNDFLTCAMDQIVNQAAKMRVMFGGQVSVPIVIRAPVGATGRGAQHSQSLEAWFMHTPGLKVVVPSTPYDAKGLLKAAIRDNNPVMFFEHKRLYGSRSPGGKARTISGEMEATMTPAPDEEYVIPLGQADIKKKGKDITVIATLFMVHRVLAIAEALQKEGIDIEVVDPRTLVPLDKETIINSVKKTGRAVIVSEDPLTCGVTSEIASIIAEEAFDYLDAPIKRVAVMDTPIPFAPASEDYVLPNEKRIVTAIRETIRL
ncbi:MAG: alpha-ketoacid dehydrogenase subunit beta [Candidatus Omnitrophota bacterium]